MADKRAHPDESKLYELARLMGVQTEYESTLGGTRSASVESLLGVVEALGAPLHGGLSGVRKALADYRLQKVRDVLEPVVVTRPAAAITVPLRISAKSPAKARVRITFENGESHESSVTVTSPRRAGAPHHLSIRRSLPLGYHALEVTLGRNIHKAALISAPATAYQYPQLQPGTRVSGLFSPAYALRSRTNWGVGDITDLADFLRFTYSSGCDFVGTLPMMALFLDEPSIEYSPYAPASRLFWNEIYLDLMKCGEWKRSQAARRRFGTRAFQAALKRLRSSPWVDYQEAYRLKRAVLQPLADEFFLSGGGESPGFKRFCEERPLVERYARFRGAIAEQQCFWPDWPRRLQQGALKDSDIDDSTRRLHLYAQYVLDLQLRELSNDSRAGGLGIYLDFPLGVHPGSFDVWAEPESFGLSATAGCPPDSGNPQGQNWGILPLHPLGLRKTGYRYLRECIASVTRYCGLLRLDHVMGFYRLYWIPKGMGAKDGAYVRYREDELFAVLCLESQRQKCVLIGEDLGTVPPEVRREMETRRILRMYVQQRAMKSDARVPFVPQPENAVASINTHDMAPFAAHWTGSDIKDQHKLGAISSGQAKEKTAARKESQTQLLKALPRLGLIRKGTRPALAELMEACYKILLRGDARLSLINVEDLWLEPVRQNTPATGPERPNWKHKLKYSLEAMAKNRKLRELIRRLTAERRRRKR